MTRVNLVMVVLLFAAGCGGASDVQCEDNANCSLGVDGQCTVSPSGNQWCSYSDGDCPSGRRWSDLAGDGLSGVCSGDEGGPDGGTADASSGTDASADAARPTDAAGSDAAPPIIWGDIQLVSNVNSTSGDYSFSISADGLELYFSSNRPGSEGLLDIWLATRAINTAPFGTPTQVDELSTTGNDQDPEISTDGTELYFFHAATGTMVSTRPNATVAWGVPSALGFFGTSPSISGDGLALYYKRSGMTNCGVNGPCFKKRTRASVGAAWSAPSDVPLPGGLQYNYIDISSNELGVLVSDEAVLGQPIAQQAWRSNVDDDFLAFEAIPTLTFDLDNGGAAWNKTETEIYLHSDRVMGLGSADVYVSLPE